MTGKASPEGLLDKRKGHRGNVGRRQSLGSDPPKTITKFTLPRVTGMGLPSTCVAPEQPRLFFTIYYSKQAAFGHAASTWQQDICKLEYFSPSFDKFCSIPVLTEPDFRSAWTDIKSIAGTKYQVWAGNILTHSSHLVSSLGETLGIPQVSTTGLEFGFGIWDGSPTYGTLTDQEIRSIPRLPWNKEFGFLILSGCNTGNSEERGWCPAAAFSFSQGVPTVGLLRTSSFSKCFGYLSRITDKDNRIHLWSYDTDTATDVFTPGTEFSAGTGLRRAGKVFV